MTDLRRTGLHYDRYIGHEQREQACLELHCTPADLDARLERLRHMRPPSRVVLNPLWPTPEELTRMLRAAEAAVYPEHRFLPEHGSPEMNREWSCERDEEGFTLEGQSLVAVLFDPVVPIGHMCFSVGLTRYADDDHIDLRIDLGLVIVMPRRRREGFGIDLSVACGEIFQDLMEATHRAAPAGSTINPLVSVVLRSKGGENIAMHLVECLDYQVELLRETGCRSSIRVALTRVDF